MAQHRKATRDEVARLARTSAAVVSYVVNGGPRPVAPATRQRVLEAIEQLGYRPNGLARALRAQRSRTLGLVVPDTSNPFFAELAHAIEDASYRAGYTLLVGNASDQPTRETAYLKAFVESRVEGVLLASTGSASASIMELSQLGAAVVVIDRRLPTVPAATITTDNESGGYMATRHLIEHGHGTVACIAGPSDVTPSADRHRGWARALAEAGLPSGSELLIRSAFNEAGGYRAAKQLFQQQVTPGALFISSDTQAIGAMRAAWECGLEIPDDVALVAFDGITAAGFTTPGLATVAQPIHVLGHHAVARLMERIAGRSTEPTEDTLAVSLVKRGSCGCAENAAENTPPKLANQGF